MEPGLATTQTEARKEWQFVRGPQGREIGNGATWPNILALSLFLARPGRAWSASGPLYATTLSICPDHALTQMSEQSGCARAPVFGVRHDAIAHGLRAVPERLEFGVTIMVEFAIGGIRSRRLKLSSTRYFLRESIWDRSAW